MPAGTGAEFKSVDRRSLGSASYTDLLNGAHLSMILPEHSHCYCNWRLEVPAEDIRTGGELSKRQGVLFDW